MLDAIRAKRVKQLAFEGTPAIEVVGYIRAATGIAFHVSPRAIELLESPDQTVTLSVDDVSVADLLSLITDEWGLRWQIVGSRIALGLPTELRGYPRDHYFDVNDLVETPPFGASPDAPTPADLVPREEQLPSRSELLAAAVRAHLASCAPEESDAPRVEVRKGVLIVKASPEAHAAIEHFLEDMRVDLARSP